MKLPFPVSRFPFPVLCVALLTGNGKLETGNLKGNFEVMVTVTKIIAIIRVTRGDLLCAAFFYGLSS
jgi:hypothetical protein